MLVGVMVEGGARSGWAGVVPPHWSRAARIGYRNRIDETGVRRDESAAGEVHPGVMLPITAAGIGKRPLHVRYSR